MGVYTSNTYNPLGSIQAALNNVNERNRIKNEYWKNKGQIWSNFANQMGQIGGRLTDALTSDYDRNDPNADAGWASYIISGDRGLLDSYQNREAQKAQLLKQQEFQAAERALQQKFQEQENERNRQNAKEIAEMNKGAAAEDRQNEAYLQYQKYVLAREKLKAQGLDTSELDLQINHLADKFGFSKPQEAEYDLNKDVNYVIAQSGAYDAINNPLNDGSEDSLEFIRDRVAQFHTPESAKELARLDREIKKRNKAIEFKEQLDKDVANYWKTGNMSDLMIELGFEEAGVAGNRRLLRGKKVYRRPRKKGSGTAPANGPISN